jgi:hypothetical protein
MPWATFKTKGLVFGTARAALNRAFSISGHDRGRKLHSEVRHEEVHTEGTEVTEGRKVKI